MTNQKKSYSELIKLKTFSERFEYLKTASAKIGEDTFGYNRYLNQSFYQSPEWKRVRRDVIIRDCGCDLGIPGYEISGKVYVHHMNEITPDDIVKRNPDILNPEYLISMSYNSHQALKFGNEDRIPSYVLQERKPNDTIPWRKPQ